MDIFGGLEVGLCNYLGDSSTTCTIMVLSYSPYWTYKVFTVLYKPTLYNNKFIFAGNLIQVNGTYYQAFVHEYMDMHSHGCTFL